MIKLDNYELLNICGGFSFNLTGILVNAFTNSIKFIYDIGRNFGSSLRRISSNNLCPLR